MAALATEEEVIEPDLPIVDPHHHLWARSLAAIHPDVDHPLWVVMRSVPRYMLEELLADAGSGHNIRATVYVECGSMYRADGPKPFRCVGETEFVNGIAAMSASGIFGPTRACAGIVSSVDLRLGDAVEDVLAAHIRAGGGRFRGIRNSGAYDPDPRVLGPISKSSAGLYRNDAFRAGFKWLERFGLSFDAWVLEPQLSDVVDLARAFPGTSIILDHVGTPLGIGGYSGRRADRFQDWEKQLRALAECENVVVKLGGLGVPFCGFSSFNAHPRPSSHQLATEWKPYIETCIGAFGVNRCMFESNFPIDKGTSSYVTVWNAFKRLAAGCSATEKAALFSDTARRIYRLEY